MELPDRRTKHLQRCNKNRLGLADSSGFFYALTVPAERLRSDRQNIALKQIGSGTSYSKNVVENSWDSARCVRLRSLKHLFSPALFIYKSAWGAMRTHQSLNSLTKGNTMISLEDWIDEWAEAVESGQSSISRAEAIRRWNQYQLDANEIDREEMEAERNDHRKIKETRE